MVSQGKQSRFIRGIVSQSYYIVKVHFEKMQKYAKFGSKKSMKESSKHA